MSEADDRQWQPQEAQPESLTGVLEALETVVSQARAMPMSSSVLVNKAEVLDLLDQAHAVLPTQLTEADQVLAGADDVLAEARDKAEQIIAAARARAAELVSNEQVVVEARVRAAEMVAEAERTAAAMRHDADDYCDRRLAEFEIDLGRIVSQVQAGRAKLADRLQDDA
jgi:F0F1-type ATP synthase membrane subunit b/b'